MGCLEDNILGFLYLYAGPVQKSRFSKLSQKKVGDGPEVYETYADRNLVMCVSKYSPMRLC